MDLYLTCKDLGTRYLILSASIQKPKSDNNFPLIKIEDTRLFTYIAEKILNNIPLTFNKNVEEITRDVIVEGDPNDTNNLRFTYVYNCYNWFSSIITQVPLYDFFQYQYLSNYFNSKGIFITEENKEEKYLEILNKDDGSLLEHLEDFLRVQDEILRYNFNYRKLHDALAALDEATTKEEMEKIFNEYKGGSYAS